MKLLHVVTLRLSLLAAVVMAFWSVLFYFALVDEVNDEADDSLEDYAEAIIVRSLAGEPLPSESSGTNNQYFLREVSADYAAAHPHVRYEDRDIYIKEKKETEPARVLTYIYRTDDGRWMEVEVSTPTFEKDDLREAILLWMVLLYAALLVGIAVTNLWGVHLSMRPLRRLLAWLDGYTPGRRLAPPHNPTGISEFRRLNQVALDALARSEELNEQQKLFIGNASHEIQTPLAACTGRIEMLLDDETLTERQMGELLKVRRTLRNLSRLNRSLLLLCKIEGGQFPQRKPVALNRSVLEPLPDFREIFAAKGIGVETDTAADFLVEMDVTLATTLTANLLKNAFVHNHAGGTVRLASGPDFLRVENTGQPEPLDPALIFTRFYHTPGKQSSTGLGLSIALAICRLYGLRLAYRHEGGRHVFEVSRGGKKV